MAEPIPAKIDPSRISIPSPKLGSDDPPSQQAPPQGDEKPSTKFEPHTAADTSELRGKRSPLGSFSLLGMADEIEAIAANAKPLLGEFVLQGQATMIYAEPNTGKTLITLRLCLDAIEGERIAPGKLYYVNADDSSSGLALKLRLMQDVGANMLAPGFKGLKAYQFVDLLTQEIEEGSATGTCVVIDTLKKFTDLMDKKRSSEFARTCRQFVMAGGTIVALGHTAKNPNSDGSPRYQGTTDILEDFDAVYIAQPLTSKVNANQRVAKFIRKKCRADSPESVAYGYAANDGVSYEEKLASVQLVDPDELEDYGPEHNDENEPQLMACIVKLITEGGGGGQMKLAKAASKACGMSERAALRVLHKYTGSASGEHLWNVQKGNRGARNYHLIAQNAPEP
jgi:hypothetical protein